MRPADRPPILWIALGGRRVGKTVLLNTVVQYFRGLGNPLRVWNAGQQNRSHTLSLLFFPDAEEVTGSGIEDGMAWTKRLGSCTRSRMAMTPFWMSAAARRASRSWPQEVPLLDALDSSSLLVVGTLLRRRSGPPRIAGACRTRSSSCDTLPGSVLGACFASPRSLGPRPSLHLVRGRSPGVVRWLRRYYGGYVAADFMCAAA